MLLTEELELLLKTLSLEDLFAKFKQDRVMNGVAIIIFLGFHQAY
jgi:hypothetical protein